MRTRLLYLIAGILLASGVLVGVGLLRAQAPSGVTRWEYIAVAPVLDTNAFPAHNVTSLTINDVKQNFSGTLPELLNGLGSDGWEYVGGVGPYMFKRPLT